MNAPANAPDVQRAAEPRTPIEGWDVSTWSDAAPPCPRCGHDGPSETVALRRRTVTEAEHHELVAALLAGSGIKLAAWERDARTDALVVAYAATVRELAVLALATLTETEIRARLDDVLAVTLPDAVVVDLRAELNRLREAAGTDLVRASARRAA